jgi:hypothetical protein
MRKSAARSSPDASSLHPVCVKGQFWNVTLKSPTKGFWVARADFLGEEIETSGCDRLCALSRWQAAAKARSVPPDIDAA